MLSLEVPINPHGFDFCICTKDFQFYIFHPKFTYTDLQILLLSIRNKNDPLTCKSDHDTTLSLTPKDSPSLPKLHPESLSDSEGLHWVLIPGTYSFINTLHNVQLTLFGKAFPYHSKTSPFSQPPQTHSLLIFPALFTPQHVLLSIYFIFFFIIYLLSHVFSPHVQYKLHENRDFCRFCWHFSRGYYSIMPAREQIVN